MENKINPITVSTQVKIPCLINGAAVNINYNVEGNNAPATVRVDGNFSSGGASSRMERTYKLDGTYTPAQEVEIYPFTAEFDTVIGGLIGQIAAKFYDPTTITL